MHVESLKMLINEKTQNGAGASTAATSMDSIKNIKETLDSNLSMCLVEQKFLEEF